MQHIAVNRNSAIMDLYSSESRGSEQTCSTTDGV